MRHLFRSFIENDVSELLVKRSLFANGGFHNILLIILIIVIKGNEVIFEYKYFVKYQLLLSILIIFLFSMSVKTKQIIYELDEDE